MFDIHTIAYALAYTRMFIFFVLLFIVLLLCYFYSLLMWWSFLFQKQIVVSHAFVYFPLKHVVKNNNLKRPCKTVHFYKNIINQVFPCILKDTNNRINTQYSIVPWVSEFSHKLLKTDSSVRARKTKIDAISTRN